MGNLKIENANKIVYQMLSDVMQTAKYETATKENILKILLQNEILFYTRQMFRVISRTP